MADSGSDSGSSFGDLIDDLVRNRDAQGGLGDSEQSDISVSSVHTSDLSDWNNLSLSESSSEDDDFVDSDAEWSDTVEDFENEPFTQQVGPTIALGLDAKPVDYFLQLFTIAMFEKMCTETTLYARQNGNQTFETSVAEMKAYIGILFLMGVVQLPSYRCYWSKRRELRQQTVADIMTRNRYEILTKYFHVNDSTQNPPRNSPRHDRLHKVRPVIENAKRQFPRHYKPHQNMAVDEAMIKFKGRCSFLQYLPAKPCKWGIKSWALADSESFYLIDFDVYTGKSNDAAPDNRPLGTRVVTKLVEPYYKKKHHVYFDNYFTSVQLMEVLLKKKTYACGTVRKDRRGLPVPLKTTKFKNSGEMRKWQKGRLTAVSWCEKKRQVNVLSTGNSIGNMELRRPGRRGQPEARYPKPIAIQDYTNNFNAVDKSDQMRSYYGIANKARKWWKYLFWFICDVTLVNAYILYREAPGGPRPRPTTHLDFHLDVAMALTAGFSLRKRRSTVAAPEAPQIKTPTVHQPTKITTTRGVRNCILCSKERRSTARGQKIQTSFECVRCGVALCKDRGCFAAFHTYQQ